MPSRSIGTPAHGRQMNRNRNYHELRWPRSCRRTTGRRNSRIRHSRLRRRCLRLAAPMPSRSIGTPVPGRHLNRNRHYHELRWPRSCRRTTGRRNCRTGHPRLRRRCLRLAAPNSAHKVVNVLNTTTTDLIKKCIVISFFAL